MLLGAFRGGNPLERIVGISDKWSGKLPRYHLPGDLLFAICGACGTERKCRQCRQESPMTARHLFPLLDRCASPSRVSPIVSASIRFTSPADSGTEKLCTSPSYTLRLRAPPLRPSAAARSGSACSEQKALPLRTGAAHGRPAFVFARHVRFAATCRLIGMGDTSSIAGSPAGAFSWRIVVHGCSLRVSLQPVSAGC